MNPIYISRGSETLGPYSLGEVQAYLLSGQLVAEDLACPAGGTQWVSLSTLPGVQIPSRQGVAAPPPPPPPPRTSPAKSGVWIAIAAGGVVVLAILGFMVFRHQPAGNAKRGWVVAELPKADSEGWVTLFDGGQLYGVNPTNRNIASGMVTLKAGLLSVDGASGWNGGIRFDWKGRNAALRVRGKKVSGQNFLIGIGRYSAYQNGDGVFGFGQNANGWHELASGKVPHSPGDFVDMEFRVAGGEITLMANGKRAARSKTPTIQESYGVSIATLNGLSLFQKIEVKELGDIAEVTESSDTAPETTKEPLSTGASDESYGLAVFGYRPLITGDRLDGWKGESGIWTIKNGIVTGALEKSDGADHLLICPESIPDDFSLRFEFMTEGSGDAYANGGIRYRMTEGSLLGYQLDVGSTTGPDGKNYEHGGRKFLSHSGKTVRVRPGAAGVPVLEDLGDACYPDAMKKAWNHAGWHQAEIIAQGNRLIHMVDGVVIADILDEDPAARRLSGSQLALKLWTGNRPIPARVMFRYLQLRSLPAAAELTVKSAVNLLTPDLENFVSVRNYGPGDFRVLSAPGPVFRMADGILHLTGETSGMLVTRAAYANYTLRGQFRWGDATSAKAENKPRNSGIWVHTRAPNDWGYECQIRETDTGSLYGFPGTLFSINGQAKRAPFQRFGRLGGRPDGKVKGERSPDEIERPHGEWNDYEVVCRGDTLTIRVNGIVTVAAVGLNPIQGHISVECSGAEIQFRNLQLLPLDGPEAVSAEGSKKPQ